MDIFEKFISASSNLYLLYNGYTIERAKAGLDFEGLLPINELIGKSIYDVLPLTIAQIIGGGIDEVSTGKKKVVKFFDVNKNGKLIHHQIKFFKTEENKVVGILSDISDAVSYRVQLENSNQFLKRILFSLSHDLREPFRNVRTFSQLLVRDFGNENATNKEEYLEYIINGTEKMSKLLDDLLGAYEVMELESSRMIVVKDVIEHELFNAREFLKSLNAQIELGEMPVIYFNLAHFQFITKSIISNAIKYRNTTEKLRIEFYSKELENQFTFKFIDNGIGITKFMQDKVFEPFNRQFVSFKNSGLSLAVCKHLVLRAGGDMWIESAEGEGTAVLFSVPKISTEIGS